jgi:hypothetical protein
MHPACGGLELRIVAQGAKVAEQVDLETAGDHGAGGPRPCNGYEGSHVAHAGSGGIARVVVAARGLPRPPRGSAAQGQSS